MSSITSWNRIEIDIRQDSLDEGLAARVHDPLWLLGRQWQLGEFRGTDGGTPVTVAISTQVAPVTTLALGSGTSQPYDPKRAPLEALVEKDGAGGFTHDLRLRARGGRQLLDLLYQRGFYRLQPQFVGYFGWPWGLTGNDESFVARMRGKIPDGAAVLAARADLPRIVASMEAVRPADLQALVDDWLAWYAPRAEPAPATSWVADRLEYSFELGASLRDGPDGSVLLQAPEYAGGRLDWDAFRFAAHPPVPSTEPFPSPPIEMHPTPVTFPGMPATRFWEIEDYNVDLGRLDAGPGDIGRLVLAEYALLWANDWFVAPIPIDQTGALVHVGGLTVIDTFGYRTILTGSHRRRRNPEFRLFRLTVESAPPHMDSIDLDDWIFIPPVLPSSLVAAPLEEVSIVRDEAANLAWAFERIVPDSQGRAVRTPPAALPLQLDDTAGRPTPGADVSTHLRYEPMTPVPAGWFPLAPVADGPRTPHLVRAQVVDDRVTVPPPRGALLSGAFRVRTDEVPHEGLTIRRRYEAARAPDGSLHLWVTREKDPAGGEVSSGLRLDHLVEVQD